jgi:hypothetical protein
LRNITNGIGNGKQNTKIIIEALSQSKETMKAAQVADAYEHGGFDDWFLPSKDELNMMYTNLKANGLGGFQSGLYWTSSQGGWMSGGRVSSYQNFSDGRQLDEGIYRDASLSVRAIRQF